jgi:CHAT domain-containing protein
MKITKTFKSIFYLLVVLTLIYVAINIIHFSWILAEPEGFWGFFYFLEVLGVIILSIIIGIGIIFFLFTGIIFLISDFPKNLTVKNIVKPLGSLLLVILILAINTITGSGISMYINKKIADRYSYINESEKLFNEGKYVEALEYSKKGYQKYGTVSTPSCFFVMSWLFYKTDYGIRRTITKQYSTTINYAYCLDRNRTDLDLAEKLYKDALTLSDIPVLNTEENYKIFPYLSLADLSLNKGNYVEGEKYFNLLLEYSNKSNKDDIEYVCVSQETFASYYQQVGDFIKARTIRENNVKLWEEKKQSRKSLQYLALLLSVTSSEIITGNFDEAGKYLVKAKSLAEKRKEKAVYPVFLMMKGLYCNYASLNGKGNEEIIEKGWFDKIVSIFKESKSMSEKFKSEAEACFLEILKIEKSANGNYSLGYAQGLQRLASFYLEQGNKIKANELLKDAKQICDKFKASDIHLYNSVLTMQSISEYGLNGYESVKSNLDELEQYHFNRLIANYTFLTEKEKESYKNLIDKIITPINSIYITTNSPETRKKLYNNIIATKEIALYANEKTRNYLEGLNDTVQKEYYEIIRQRDSIEIDKNKVNSDNAELVNSILLREKAIQTKISSMPGFTPFDPRTIRWENISASLKENEIAIEFVHSNINKTEQYFALLIKKDLPAPELIPLFEESVLKNLLNQPGNSENRINTIYGKLKDSLYSLTWKPIEEKLANINKAYISASGILYSISFPAMLDDKSIDVVLLGSTRQIPMKSGDKGQRYSSAVLVGGVNYGIGTNGNRTVSEKTKYTDLSFTIQEVQDINKILLSKHPEIKVTLVTRDSASETAFRSLQKLRPNLIHLATHGFYYPTSNFNSSNLITEIYPRANLNPMLRSGIVLAGANNDLNPDTENDGFLSAQEIARMNLSNLDLAVLSACETGLGEIIGSEGVFGLQRAFKLAGANSLIMSLWRVPDEQTSELMSHFYKNYMNGMTKSFALKEAQLTMKQKYKNPFCWGGFILLEK